MRTFIKREVVEVEEEDDSMEMALAIPSKSNKRECKSCAAGSHPFRCTFRNCRWYFSTMDRVMEHIQRQHLQGIDEMACPEECMTYPEEPIRVEGEAVAHLDQYDSMCLSPKRTVRLCHATEVDCFRHRAEPNDNHSRMLWDDFHRTMGTLDVQAGEEGPREGELGDKELDAMMEDIDLDDDMVHQLMTEIMQENGFEMVDLEFKNSQGITQEMINQRKPEQKSSSTKPNRTSNSNASHEGYWTDPSEILKEHNNVVRKAKNLAPNPKFKPIATSHNQNQNLESLLEGTPCKSSSKESPVSNKNAEVININIDNWIDEKMKDNKVKKTDPLYNLKKLEAEEKAKIAQRRLKLESSQLSKQIPILPSQIKREVGVIELDTVDTEKEENSRLGKRPMKVEFDSEKDKKSEKSVGKRKLEVELEILHDKMKEEALLSADKPLAFIPGSKTLMSMLESTPCKTPPKSQSQSQSSDSSGFGSMESSHVSDSEEITLTELLHTSPPGGPRRIIGNDLPLPVSPLQNCTSLPTPTCNEVAAATSPKPSKTKEKATKPRKEKKSKAKVKAEPKVRPEPTVYYSYEFIVKNGLREHARNGGGARPYFCPVPGCPKKYKNPNGLKYHARYGHSPPQSFPCEKCFKQYTTRHGLLAHQKTHSDYVPKPKAAKKPRKNKKKEKKVKKLTIKLNDLRVKMDIFDDNDIEESEEEADTSSIFAESEVANIVSGMQKDTADTTTAPIASTNTNVEFEIVNVDSLERIEMTGEIETLDPNLSNQNYVSIFSPSYLSPNKKDEIEAEIEDSPQLVDVSLLSNEVMDESSNDAPCGGKDQPAEPAPPLPLPLGHINNNPLLASGMPRLVLCSPSKVFPVMKNETGYKLAKRRVCKRKQNLKVLASTIINDDDGPPTTMYFFPVSTNSQAQCK